MIIGKQTVINEPRERITRIVEFRTKLTMMDGVASHWSKGPIMKCYKYIFFNVWPDISQLKMFDHWVNTIQLDLPTFYDSRLKTCHQSIITHRE